MNNEITKNNSQTENQVEQTQKLSETEKTDELFTIYKKESYRINYCIVESLDKETLDKFNAGEKIQITKEDFEKITPHRWLGVEK